MTKKKAALEKIEEIERLALEAKAILEGSM